MTSPNHPKRSNLYRTSRRKKLSARRQLLVEQLESRRLLATVTWTGLGDGLSWANANNWLREGVISVPQSGDDALIPNLGDPGIRGDVNIQFSSAVSLKSLTNAEKLTISGGSLTVATASQIFGGLNLIGGQFGGSGELTLQGDFIWTGGTMSGAGRTLLLASASGSIAANNSAFLGRVLENRGTLLVTGPNSLYFEASASEPGVLLNEAGATLTFSGGADLQRNGSNSANRLENRGTLVKDGTAETALTGVRLNNDGIIEVRNGALTVSQGGIDMAFNGSNYLRTQPGTTLRIANSITGTTTNSDFFSPRGVTIFTGGTPAAPRLLEVMGRDFGVVATGFDQNFAFGALVVDSGSYVQLTNDADNVLGDEALYVDTLIVRQGSTFDLSLRQVYARIVQIDGILIGGTINRIPDGGLIAVNSSASGSISESGQVDEWSFFGRAGQAITLFVDPGQNGSVQPSAPYLVQVAVDVLTPNGEVLSSAVSAGPSQAVSILGVELPGAGTYRIRVRSAPSQASAKGNYYLSLSSPTFRINAVTPTISGFQISFGSAPDLSVLNLYDGIDASLDPVDLTLVGTTLGPIPGSLVWNAANNTFEFIKTGGPLAADSYTLTLFSRDGG